MKAMMLVARRELGSYLNTVWGWGILAFVLLIDGLLFNAYALGSSAKYSSTCLEGFFYFSSGTTMIAGILLTIRVIAEERQTGTLVILQKAPISEGPDRLRQVPRRVRIPHVRDAAHDLHAAAHLREREGEPRADRRRLSRPHRARRRHDRRGHIRFGRRAQPTPRGVVGAGVLVVLLLGWMLGRVTEPPVSGILSYMAIFDRHFQPFERGRINTESLVYFASVTFAFLLLATRALARGDGNDPGVDSLPVRHAASCSPASAWSAAPTRFRYGLSGSAWHSSRRALRTTSASTRTRPIREQGRVLRAVLWSTIGALWRSRCTRSRSSR
jgi:ABC-2 type transport system permease protein